VVYNAFMRTLVWLTHSFRLNSRLMSELEGDVTFVYYSPYYFGGERERRIYDTCSQANLDAFYESLHAFDFELAERGFKLSVFKESDPVKHINSLIRKHDYDQVMLDVPMFAFPKSIDLHDIDKMVIGVDSDLVDDQCERMTAKSRWMSHVKQIADFKPFKLPDHVKPFNLSEPSRSYPKPELNPLLDPAAAMKRARKMAPTYHVTRDRHDGQTQLSTILHNGRLDPREVFFTLAKDFVKAGANLTVNEGPAAGMLRQLAFREIAIIRTRRTGLSLADSPQAFAEQLMPAASYENLVKQKPGGKVTFDMVKAGKTGVHALDVLLRPFLKTGIMPNRARMLYASLIFYNSPTGIDALNTIIDTFDLLGLDGQSPNNYTQVCGALELSYGKVLQMNIDTAFKKLYDKA
jgi:deoxyribodipyrimidine photolyase